MSYSVIGILAFLIKFTSSMECPGCSVSDNLIESFNDKAVTDFVLSESVRVVKLMDCIVMCSRDIRCRSYRHNVQTGTCSTYGAGYSLPEKTINATTADVGSRLYAMCGMSKAFASICSVDADCDFANSTCLSGSCACVVGYSYIIWTGDCLIRCPSYGPWFSTYPNSDVIYCNYKRVFGLTPDGCKQACSDNDSFVCINAEYWGSGNTSRCVLCHKAWFDLDPAHRGYGTAADWNVFYRHCGY